LKIWVTLLKPKIEDGNNFGVDVQEDVLADIETVNLDAATYYDKISFYYSSRAKLVSKVCVLIYKQIIINFYICIALNRINYRAVVFKSTKKLD